MKTRLLMAAVLVAAGAGVMAGCESSTLPESRSDAQMRTQDVQTAIEQIKERDPSSQQLFDNCWAYAVFPTVKQAGLGIGGAGGNGEVYRNGKLIGYATLTQASVGAQIGGATFSEVIFFENALAWNQFKSGQLAFDARAHAVAASAGAGAAANYENGVVVYTLPQGGLMAQATVGGQKFTYEPAGGLASEKE